MQWIRYSEGEDHEYYGKIMYHLLRRNFPEDKFVLSVQYRLLGIWGKRERARRA
jgi:hypothetical protein